MKNEEEMVWANRKSPCRETERVAGLGGRKLAILGANQRVELMYRDRPGYRVQEGHFKNPKPGTTVTGRKR
jgi:hypothetical protein